MSQPTIANNLLQALEVVNSPYKQAHRSIDCCDLYCEYPLPTPQGLLPHFQFRTLSTITSVEVYDVTDTLADTWDTSIFQIDVVNGLNYYSYMGATVPDLDCGKYYLKLISAAGDYFTQLFVVTSICCLPQLLWWNNCNTQNTLYETGYTNQLWMRALGDARFESVAVSETTEQDGTVFKEYGALEDYFSIEIAPIYNYLVRALQSVTLHENIVYIDRNGEYAKLLGMSVEEINSVGGRCLYKVKLKMRQANAFNSNYCCDEIADATTQNLPTPQDTGCGNADPCFAPQISSILVSATTATISWYPVSGATEYQISINGGAFSSIGNVTEYELTSLTSCTDYTICIRTDCGENNSVSTCTHFTTAAIPCGSCPEENYYVTAITATGINIAFDGSAAATGYEIQWKPISEIWALANSDTITGTAGTNNYSINTLQPCTTYQIRFRPICEGNECNPIGCWSLISGTTECCEDLIDFDIDITEGSCIDASADITITVTDYDTNYTITIYQGGSTVASSTDTPLNTTLAPGIYTVIVTDRLCASNPFSFTIGNPCPCVAPSVLQAFPSATNATLDWNDILNATAYELQWRMVTDTVWVNVTGLVASAYLLHGLDSCTVYEWRVRSVCEGNTSDWSSINVFQTIGCDENTECENNEAMALSCKATEDGYCFTVADAGVYQQTPLTNVVQMSLDTATWVDNLCLIGPGGPGYGFFFLLAKEEINEIVAIDVTTDYTSGVYSASAVFGNPISGAIVSAVQAIWDDCDGNIFMITTNDANFYTIKGQPGNSFSIDVNGFTITYNDSSTLYGAGLAVLAQFATWEATLALGNTFSQVELDAALCFTTQFFVRHTLTFENCPPINVQYAIYDILSCECYNQLNLNTNIETTIGECDCTIIITPTA